MSSGDFDRQLPDAMKAARRSPNWHALTHPPPRRVLLCSQIIRLGPNGDCQRGYRVILTKKNPSRARGAVGTGWDQHPAGFCGHDHSIITPPDQGGFFVFHQLAVVAHLGIQPTNSAYTEKLLQ